MQHGWLAPATPLPEDGEIAVVIGQALPRADRHRRAVRDLVARRSEQGVGGVAIHAALCREHGYSGSYSAVRRMLAALNAARPPQATVRLPASRPAKQRRSISVPGRCCSIPLVASCAVPGRS